MKYIDADKLIAEIERYIKHYEKLNRDEFKNGELYICQELLSFIKSLRQEQQEVDLEKEIDVCWQNWLSPSNRKEVEGVLPKTEFAMYARHFYELGKNSK